MRSSNPRPMRPWLAAFLLFWTAAAAFAQQADDPPGRVAVLSYQQGSVVFAPEGEDEWTDLPRNRPLTIGDRVWTDRGSRAELQLGSATLQVDGESHVGLSALDEGEAQFIVQQGSVNARVRELLQGENFEIDTPNLALRALQPGEYRVDVDPNRGQTRVSVQSGRAAVFGETGESIQIGAGQQATFARRDLAQVQGGTYRPDDFSRWAAERNRREDQSASARYLPRGVVGAAELDAYGNWGQDPEYGAVWYPRVTVDDWAPYRYGSWEWVQPWGWTWVDEAPWGFAPFHYGRWTMIGNRWAWVPGPLEARPLYAPALVVFMGDGGSNFAFSAGSGPAVGWYPLAPGEAWWPTYHASPRYLGHANHRINLGAYPRNYRNHVWRQRPWAITAVGEDDFRHGRRVDRHRESVRPGAIGNAQVGIAPPRPAPREERHRDRDRDRAQPRLQAVPPQSVQPAVSPRFGGDTGIAPAVREQWRAQREQDRLQRDAERNAREQQREAERQRQGIALPAQPGAPLHAPQQRPQRQMQIQPQPVQPQPVRPQLVQPQLVQPQLVQPQLVQPRRELQQERQRAEESRPRQIRERPATVAPAAPLPPAPIQVQPPIRVQPQVQVQPPPPARRIEQPRQQADDPAVVRPRDNDGDGPGRGRRLRAE